MAQLFSSIFFTLAAISALGLLASLLWRDGRRVIAILAGMELAHARRMSSPAARVRVRVRTGPERRRLQPLRAAA